MYELLLVLVRYHDRILEKEFLLESVWPDSFVEQGNISFNINQLRKVLGDDAQTPAYIETIPRRGYRFVANVEECTAEELTDEPNALGDAESRPGRSRRVLFAAVTGAAVLIAGFAAVAWFLSSRVVRAAPILSAPFALERLSTDGQAHLAAMSRDGKMVVYSRRNAGKQGLWIMQPGTTDNSELVPLSDFVYYGLAISPDGKYVYFTRGERTGQGQQQPDIYRESIFGGAPQRIVKEAQGWISLSPDGEKVSFVRCPYTEEEYCSLWIADSIDGSNERKLLSRPRPFRIADNQISPDGKTIAFAVGQSRTASNDFSLSEVDIDGAAVRDLTSEKFFNIQHLGWLPNRELLLTARQEPDKNFRIWQVSANGAASPLTDDSQSYSELSLNDDGSLLVTSQVAPNFHLNVYKSRDAVLGPKRLANAQTVNFAPNGEIVFSSARTGNQEIWSINSDGSSERQLTNSPSDDVAPIVSPDNAVIFFASNRTGKIQIWKMNRDGSNQTQVTHIEGGNPSSVSPDGLWLYYKSALEKTFRRVSIEDGHEELIFDRSSQDSALAPSGDRVALTDKVNKENVLDVVALPNGAVIKKFNYPEPKATTVCLIWSHDEKYLAYVLTDEAGQQQTLWFQPMDGKEPRKVIDLNEEVYELSGLALSLDDQSIAVVQGTWNHDAVLIKGLK